MRAIKRNKSSERTLDAAIVTQDADEDDVAVDVDVVDGKEFISVSICTAHPSVPLT
jgi:hypothetical protein